MKSNNPATLADVPFSFASCGEIGFNLLYSMTLCVEYDAIRTSFHAVPHTGRGLTDDSIIPVPREGRRYGAKISGRWKKSGWC